MRRARAAVLAVALLGLSCGARVNAPPLSDGGRGDGACLPDCRGRACLSDDDGCGSPCQPGSDCYCSPTCDGVPCGQGNGCGGICQQGSGCVCTSSCDGKVCDADDGCGHTCVPGSGCCTPSCDGKNCGADDGCSGTCPAGSGCCPASCQGGVCGASDGCGGRCDGEQGDPCTEAEKLLWRCVYSHTWGEPVSQRCQWPNGTYVWNTYELGPSNCSHCCGPSPNIADCQP